MEQQFSEKTGKIMSYLETHKRRAAVLIIFACIIFSFQNCASKTEFSSNSQSSSDPAPVGDTGNPDDISLYGFYDEFGDVILRNGMGVTAEVHYSLGQFKVSMTVDGVKTCEATQRIGSVFLYDCVLWAENLSNGIHTFAAILEDGSGKIIATTRQALFKVDKVVIASPASDAKVSGILNVSAYLGLSVPSGSMEVDGGSPVAFTGNAAIDTGALSNGSHSILISAPDLRGIISAAFVRFTVEN